MVSVFSRPQKMVFDYVYGRREGGCDKQTNAVAMLSGDSTSLYHTHCAVLLQFSCCLRTAPGEMKM
jgi:hypothetical protein